MLAWHINTHLAGRAPIVTDLPSRRLAARTILRTLEARGLLAFSIPDDHLHLLLQVGEEERGRAVQAVCTALVHLLGLKVSFGRYHSEEVNSRAHLDRCLLYVLGQHQHHGVAVDPLRESSALPDILSLRGDAPWLAERVRETFPRLQREDLLPLLGVSDLRSNPNPAALPQALESAGGQLRHLVAAAHVGRALGVDRSALPVALGASPRTVRRWLASTPDPTAVEVIRRQLAVRGQLGVGR